MEAGELEPVFDALEKAFAEALDAFAIFDSADPRKYVPKWSPWPKKLVLWMMNLPVSSRSR